MQYSDIDAKDVEDTIFLLTPGDTFVMEAAEGTVIDETNSRFLGITSGRRTLTLLRFCGVGESVMGVTYSDSTRAPNVY